MSKIRVIISILMCVAMALFLYFSPQYIITGTDRDRVGEWLTPSKEGFTGTISVWHIVGFKPYIGGVSNWLSARAKTVEKRHFGVFIEVEAMTLAECEERMKNGECADMYSFPSGWCGSSILRPIGAVVADDIDGRFFSTGVSSGEQYAVPYMYSGYMLALNTAVANERSVKLPNGETFTNEWVCDAAKKMSFERGKKRERVYGAAGNRTVAALLGIVGDVGKHEHFRANEAAMTVTDIRGIGDLERAAANGNDISIRYYPIGEYTDLVQYIGVAAGTDEAKLPYALEFIEQLFTEKAQEKLVQIGLFPVVLPEEKYVFEQTCAGLLYEALLDTRIPNTFLLNSARTDIENAVENALVTGETDRLKKILESLRQQKK